MAFGDRTPPYSIPETNTGIEIEVISEALAYRGHALKPVYLPLSRIPIAFKSHIVDAAMTDLGEDLRPYGGFYGGSAVVYDNVFITLANRGLKITKPADLEGLSVISFVGGAKRYPKWLEQVVKQGRYFEQNNQAVQVLTLELGRYDVVLSDRHTFNYFAAQQQAKQTKPLQPRVEHNFEAINPENYRPVFLTRELRDDFNEGLKRLKASGRLQAICDHYLKEG